MTLTKDSSFTVTARKYRPQTFDAVISQAHVTRTLRNALASGRQAHAYLFSGPRGVGKTTLARLLAKGLHCEKAPTGDPCNVCEGCRAIAEARSLDYQEIDGASNRGIDQIRELNASLGYASPNQKHRVFVIDEVHMLTTEAFNALLKSLEEPPPKVMFVFCTTEVHKVPITIRSRCQHYVFKAFALTQVRDQLAAILKDEGIEADDEALFLIARAANGSMRDGQSLLDQAVAYAGERLTADAAREVLGLAAGDGPMEFLGNLADAKLDANQALLRATVLGGTDSRQFFLEIVRLLNALVFIKSGILDGDRLELSARDLDGLQTRQDRFALGEVFTILDLCHDLLRELRRAGDERVLLDFYLIKLHRYRELVTPEQLKAELGRLLAEGQGPRAAQEGGASSRTTPAAAPMPADRPPPAPRIPASAAPAQAPIPPSSKGGPATTPSMAPAFKAPPVTQAPMGATESPVVKKDSRPIPDSVKEAMDLFEGEVVDPDAAR